MQISIVSDTGSDVLIHGPLRPAADYATGPVGEIRFSDEHSIQVARHLRAAVAAVHARGNVVCTCRFVAMREFASTFAAKVWLATHMTTVRRSTQLRLVEGSGRLLLTGGALGPIQAVPAGVELMLNYSFTFTGVTT